MRRILVNSNFDRFRKRRLAEYPTDEPLEPSGPHPTDAGAQFDQRQVLFAALATLPARQRAVVVLRYWEDLSEAQVAAALGCSAGTVKSQAAKGLAKLRAHSALTDLSTPATTDSRLKVSA